MGHLPGGDRCGASEEEEATWGVGPTVPLARAALRPPGGDGRALVGRRRQRKARPAARPPAPLTSSAWPSSRSKVTTHTHSSQAEKRAQGAAAARAPGDASPKRPRPRRGPAPDSESMAAGTAPAERCRGNGSETLPGELLEGGGLGAGRDSAAEQSSGRRGLEGPCRGLRTPGGRRSVVWRSDAESTREKGPRGPERPEPGGGTSGEGCRAGRDSGKTAQAGVGLPGAPRFPGALQGRCGSWRGVWGGGLRGRRSRPNCVVADFLPPVGHEFQSSCNVL